MATTPLTKSTGTGEQKPPAFLARRVRALRGGESQAHAGSMRHRGRSRCRHARPWRKRRNPYGQRPGPTSAVSVSPVDRPVVGVTQVARQRVMRSVTSQDGLADGGGGGRSRRIPPKGSAVEPEIAAETMGREVDPHPRERSAARSSVQDGDRRIVAVRQAAPRGADDLDGLGAALGRTERFHPCDQARWQILRIIGVETADRAQVGMASVNGPCAFLHRGFHRHQLRGLGAAQESCCKGSSRGSTWPPHAPRPSGGRRAGWRLPKAQRTRETRVRGL